MDNIKFNEVNEEVIYINEPIARINIAEIELLKKKAVKNQRKRIRICTHRDVNDAIHEMLIVHVKGAYIRPHKSFNKIVSYHIIDGDLKVVVFNDTSDIIDVIDMGNYTSGKNFYYRLADSYFYTVIPVSDLVVFHEIVNGPFVREDTVFADWSPDISDAESCKRYLEQLDELVARFILNKKEGG